MFKIATGMVLGLILLTPSTRAATVQIVNSVVNLGVQTFYALTGLI